MERLLDDQGEMYEVEDVPYNFYDVILLVESAIFDLAPEGFGLYLLKLVRITRQCSRCARLLLR